MSLKRILKELAKKDILDDFEKQRISNYDEFYRHGYDVDEDHIEHIDKDLKKQIKESIKSAIKIVESKLNIFKKITVRLISDPSENENVLARYVHESAVDLLPYIILYYDTIINSYDEGYDIDTIVHTTIFHELGHAMVDIDNAYIFIEDENIFDFNDEEKFVEDFAFNLYMFKRVDPIFKRFEKEIKKIGTHKVKMDKEYFGENILIENNSIINYINKNIEDFLFHVTTTKALKNGFLYHPDGGALFFDFHFSLDMEAWLEEIVGEYGGKPILIRLPKNKINKYKWNRGSGIENEYIYTFDKIKLSDLEIEKL